MTGHFPRHLDKTEEQIIGSLIDRALARGWSIVVNDEVEVVLPRSTDRGRIQGAVGNTGLTILTFFGSTPHLKSARIGMIALIHGNGEDVIADCSAVADIEALIEEVVPV